MLYHTSQAVRCPKHDGGEEKADDENNGFHRRKCFYFFCKNGTNPEVGSIALPLSKVLCSPPQVSTKKTNLATAEVTSSWRRLADGADWQWTVGSVDLQKAEEEKAGDENNGFRRRKSFLFLFLFFGM